MGSHTSPGPTCLGSTSSTRHLRPTQGAAAPGTKAALSHFKGLSAAFTEAHPTKSAHPSNPPAVTGRAAGSKGMLNEVLLEYLTF